MRIAIIATNYVYDYIKHALESLQLDCEFTYYTYQNFADLITIFEKACAFCDGIITSGYFPTQILRKHFPDSKLVIEQINVDDADLYQFLIKLVCHDRSLDLTRIYADFLDIIDTDPARYIEEERIFPYTLLQKKKYKDFDAQDLIGLEQEYLSRHLRIWDSGTVDMCLTRFSSLVTPLKEHGVNVCFPFPSKEYLLRVYNETAKNIMIQQLKSALPAVVSVQIANKNISDMVFDSRCAELYRLSIEYRRGSDARYSIQKTRLGIEIITDTKALEQMTNDYKETPYADFIKDKVEFDIDIGYGLGDTVYDASQNAKNALEESMHYKGEKSFIFAPGGKRIGPLKQAQMIIIDNKPSKELIIAAKKAALSTLTVEKATKAILSKPDGKITAKELSHKLDITVRSANRIMTALLKAEYVVIAGEKKVFTKGRPEKIYALKQSA